MSEWWVRWLDRIFAVIGALILLQAPLFMHEYTQQLVGHVSELQYQIASIEKTATDRGKNIEQYIEKFTKSKDQDISFQGKFMQRMVFRLKSLSHSLSSLQESSLFIRPFIFLFTIDFSIAAKTFQFFQPGIPISLEAILYAIIGILVGYYLFCSIYKIFQLLFSRPKNLALQSNQSNPI